MSNIKPTNTNNSDNADCMHQSSGPSINSDTTSNGTNSNKINDLIDSESWQELTQSTGQSSNPSNESFTNVINEEKDNDEEELYEKNLEIALEHKIKGNKYYKLKAFDQALDEYFLAINHCPENDDTDQHHLSVFYGNRAACSIALEDWESAVEDCTHSIEQNDKYFKAYFRRAKAYENLEKYLEAKQDYEKILEMYPDHPCRGIAEANLKRIEPLVKQQFEKQKEEVVDKLKGFANWGLGKIGLSLDNFETTQNPETGSYNINFKQ